MEDEFLGQFIAVAWRFFVLIGFLIALAVFVAARNRNKKKEERRAKKEAIIGQDGIPREQRSQKQGRRPQPSAQRREEPEDFEPLSSGGSIFDDESFFEDDNLSVTPVATDDDPLAELYEAREQAQYTSTTEDDEEVVELASLLVNMAEDPKIYHEIAEDPVAVKLVTKQIAVAEELLTIMRDDRDGRLMVQIGDAAFRTLQHDSSARKTFARVMKELSNVIMVEDASPPESAKLEGEQPNKMVSELIDVRVSSGGDTKAREMMSILRDTADGHLMVQIGNTGYRSLSGHDKAKAGFAKVMKELSAAVTTPDDNPPQIAQPPAPQTQQPRKAIPAFGSPIISDDGSNNDPLPGDIRLPSMDDMPDAYSVDRFGRVRVKKLKDSEKVEPINIAEAINEYLQYKISITPQFQGRGITIRSSIQGGVLIDVDGQTYEFVDEVAEPDAQAFIRLAIDEWQERH